MHTRKRRCTYEELAPITMVQPPLPPRRASIKHYARPGHVPFDERSHKLATLTVESFGCLGIEGSNFIDQLAASVVGGRDDGSMARKGVVKERLLQKLSR